MEPGKDLNQPLIPNYQAPQTGQYPPAPSQGQPFPQQGYQQPTVYGQPANLPPGYVMTPQGYLAFAYYKGKRNPEKNLPGSFDKYNGGFLSDILEESRGLFIRQRTDWLQALTGCTQETHFAVQNIDATYGAVMLRCSEKSDFCARQCLSGSCRPFKVYVTNCFDGTTAMEIEREFTCTCFCAGRPFANIYVFDDAGQRLQIGRISQPFTCCDYSFQISDHQNQQVYTLRTPLCQKALVCQCPCDECQIVEFDVIDKEGVKVTNLLKTGKGCVKNAMTNSDNFAVRYVEKMPWNHRALLLASVIFLDFRMFEDKNRNRQNNGVNGFNVNI